MFQTTNTTFSQTKSLKNSVSVDLMTADTFERVLDPEDQINDIVGTLQDHWEFNLEDRKPGPAILHGGQIKATDLDLACLLSTLAKRHAVVVLPKYLSGSTKKASVPGQTLISADHRRGNLIRLSSNQEYFSFSLLVQDMNVQNADGSLGAPRYFHILGKDGRFHPGWESISFVPDAAENKFISQFGLDVKGSIPFDTFVHPSRWVSFYSPYYLLTKLVISRLEDEASVIRARIKELKSKQAKAEKGYTFQKDDSDTSFKTRTITVPVFEASVVPTNDQEFDYPYFETNLEDAQADLKETESALSDLRFATRTTELAFYKARQEKAGIPASVNRVGDWETETVKRTNYRQLVINPVRNGPTLNLRYRTRAKDIEIPVL